MADTLPTIDGDSGPREAVPVVIFDINGAAVSGGTVANQGVVPGSTETKITAAAMPTGGVGFVGWLSAIWYQLTQGISPSTDAAKELKITAATIPTGGVGYLGWLSAIWYQLTQGISPSTDAAKELKITAATIPAGGVGYLGWLSAVWYQLTQSITVAGDVASLSADSGKPVKAGLVYNTTLPAPTTGNRVDAQADPSGNIRARLVALISSAADGTSNVIGWTCSSAAQIASAVPLAIAPFKHNGTTNTWDRDRKPNATSRIVSAAATTNATSAKGSPGDLHKAIGISKRGSDCFLKIANKATAMTPGTDTPTLTITIPANAYYDIDFNGQYFPLGITYCFTTGSADNDTGALTAGDIIGHNLIFA
jgi:hypothetical protein